MASLSERYLELLKASVLDELYLENEMRLLYVARALCAGVPVDFDVVRRIGERAPDLVGSVRAARVEGRPWWLWSYEANGERRHVDLRNTCEFAHTMIGRKRLDSLHRCLDTIRAENVPGDLIEAGVWRGGAVVFLRGYLAAHEMTGRTVWVADSFAGLPGPRLAQDAGHDYSAARMPILAVPLEEVRETFRRYGLLDDRVRFLEGWFKDTLQRAPIEQLALARLDGDLYESTLDALRALYPRLAPGGFVIVDDYGAFEPCRRAVDEFRAELGIGTPLETIDWSGVQWRRS
jgi:glycosyltransferase involved in cell wall biosynthesis